MELRRTPNVWWLAALALALVAPACSSGSSTAAANPGPTARTGTPSAHSGTAATGFETGTLGPFAESERARVTHAAAKNGDFGLDVHATGADAYASWDGGDNGGWWSFRAWMRVISWTPGQSVDLFTVRNQPAKNNFDFFVDTPVRTFRWDLYRGDTAIEPGPITLGQWHLVEAKGSFASTTYVADVRVDGVPQASITSTGQVPSSVRDLVLGPGGTTKTNEVQFDDVRIAVGSAPIAFLGPPRATS